MIQYSSGNYTTLLHSTAGGTTTARGSRSTVGNGWQNDGDGRHDNRGGTTAARGSKATGGMMTTTGLNVLSKFKFADALCESPLFGMRSGDNDMKSATTVHFIGGRGGDGVLSAEVQC